MITGESITRTEGIEPFTEGCKGLRRLAEHDALDVLRDHDRPLP